MELLQESFEKYKLPGWVFIVGMLSVALIPFIPQACPYPDSHIISKAVSFCETR